MRRFWQGLGMLLVLSIAVFLLSRLSGSPAYLLLPADASQEEVVALEASLGLDEPLATQYARYVSGLLTGDLGESIHRRMPVTSVIGERIPATLHLAAAGAIVMLLGIPLGIIAALYRARVPDFAIGLIAALGQAAPHFFVGVVLVFVFGVSLGLLPVAGRSGWSSAILPAIALGLFPLASITRLTRTSMLKVLEEEYILSARARGLAERVIVLRHALRNAIIPVTSLASVMFLAYFMTGSVVVETVFAWPGLGYLAYQSVTYRDYPVLQGVVLLFGVMYVVGIGMTNALFRILDPRAAT